PVAQEQIAAVNGTVPDESGHRQSARGAHRELEHPGELADLGPRGAEGGQGYLARRASVQLAVGAPRACSGDEAVPLGGEPELGEGESALRPADLDGTSALPRITRHGDANGIDRADAIPSPRPGERDPGRGPIRDFAAPPAGT